MGEAAAGGGEGAHVGAGRGGAAVARAVRDQDSRHTRAQPARCASER